MNDNDNDPNDVPVDSDALTCPRCKTVLLAAQTYPNLVAMAEEGTAMLRRHYAIFHPTNNLTADLMAGLS